MFALKITIKQVYVVSMCSWLLLLSRVPRRQPHRRSGLATLPSVGAVP